MSSNHIPAKDALPPVKNTLPNQVIDALARIPKGCVVSYKDLASEAGMPGAWRHIGSLVGKNSRPIVIPCHRVVKSNGEIGSYTYKGKNDPTKKKELLESEGVTFKPNGQVSPRSFHKF